ncbi:ATP-binding protein [Paraglaciecola sp. 25GB23A]|uniref:hybrid sensor histidine kinase/response regulator n=1 Tax=Paraglaciecola sp. 25GB23A TaxID=3156068 RepID=UPI0032AF4DC0
MQQNKAELSRSDIRNGLTNIVIGSAAVLVFFATCASLLRYHVIGFQPIMLVHVLLSCFIVLLYVLRNIIALNIRALLICSIFFIAGLGGLVSFGLAGAGTLILFGACVISSLLVSIRLAVIFAVSGAAALSIGLMLSLDGSLSFNIPLDKYLLSPEAWLNNLLTYGYLVTISLLLIKRFSLYLNSFLSSQAQIIKSQTKQIDVSENILEAVVNSLPYGILWKDTQLRYLGANKYFLQDAKIRDVSKVIGKTDKDLFPSHLAQRVTELDKQVLTSAKDSENKLEEHTDKQGNTVFIATYRKMLRAKDGELLGVLCAYHNVTERTLMEQQLRDSKALADQANLAKSLFLANMSHEIRTPLNGILGLIDLSLMTKLDNTQLDYLSKAKLSANTLLYIINDILDLSKIEAGQMQLEHIPFDIKTVLADVNEQFFYIAQNKGIEFSVSYDGPRSLWVKGDPVRLLQILINLCSNSIKFTEQGKVTLTCEAAVEQSNANLLLKISDTGIGMDTEALPLLFTKFTQLDSSISRKFGGTGLGLSIVKGLVDTMAGEITVTSHLGQGSCFAVNLALPLGEQELQPTSADKPVNLSGKQILLADDNEINRVIVEQLLGSVGATVVSAENGQIALDKLASQDFDMVLMDIQMPVMDGCTAIGHIRANKKYQSLPLIALTANAMKHEIELYEKLGFAAHVAKPFDFTLLLNAIKKHLLQS